MVDEDGAGGESLCAGYEIAFPFERTTGTMVGTFLGGLRERRLLGVRTGRGTVLCPPAEFDPVTGEPLSELVDLEPEGSVRAWTWVPPRAGDPVPHPFAWALVAVDGTEGSFFHAVDTGGDPDRLRRGLRVRARWAEQPRGELRDLVCFEPLERP
ncbi:Zn-ribbon domain-containing OB-fold protein [Nocardia sp. alder85J]|uniref:Zn-ribbon domain-containing OB-fold protein n=1 Tax=Nocardia sp. alder85J TaxID=2862949 RepID=UPI001CD74D81|nr:OB-fold domain-containing protein [Nocardia sp. alder85J]MCX4096919.1 OB-fold domain-containing protein [Nocardia sp. alder85J]